MASRFPSPSDYTIKLAGSLNDFRKENQLCDIIIKVDGRAFHAHKNILAARSSYFLAMFTSGFREATESEVNIDGKSEIFEMLLEYMYTGKLTISGETAFDLLEMACYMQLNDLSQHCSEFIQVEYDLSSDKKEKIPMGDVYRLYEMASLHDHMKVLAQKSELHLCNYFKKLKSSDVFLQKASVEFMKRFLRRSDLAKKDDEKEVLELVVKWLKHDWGRRRSYATSLLNKVRLGLVPRENLTQLLDADILKIRECKILLQATRKMQRSKKSVYKLSKAFPRLFATRSIISAPITVSTKEGESTYDSSFYYYNIKHRQWRPIGSIPQLDHLPSLIVIGGTLYAVGGVEEIIDDEYSEVEPRWPYDHVDYWDESNREVHFYTEYINDFRRYDAEHNYWVALPPLSRYCGDTRLVHLNGCIYVLGGKSQYCHRRYCEVFDIAKNKWNEIAAPPEEIKCSSAVAYQGSILMHSIVSVRHGNGRRSYTETILVYNPSVNEWQPRLSKPDQTTDKSTKPLLFVHGDRCYRVGFRNIPKPAGSTNQSSGPTQQKAEVHLLKLRSSRNKVVSTITIDEEIKQDFIPANHIGAFRIGEDVFVTTNAIVHQTNIKIRKDQDTDIVLDKWRNFAKLKRRSNIVNFTCDWRNQTPDQLR